MGAFILDLEGRLFGITLGLAIGSLVTWLTARWRLANAKRQVEVGDAGDTLVIELQLLERAESGLPWRFRRRYLGQEVLSSVIANPHLAREFRKRAKMAGRAEALITMTGAAGTYLLECFAGFVCDRVANAPFDHGQYVMAACRDPEDHSFHKPLSVVLISTADLELFLSWSTVQGFLVEHSTDAVRLLTLAELARRWQAERSEIARRRAAGLSVRYVETMFLLDLAIDRRVADLETRPVPWQRYAGLLSQRGLPLNEPAAN